MKKLNREFYNRDTILVARELLGKVLVCHIDGQRFSSRIREVEAYMGLEDQAAHSYGGRRTPRVEVMYGAPGFAYIYQIYGLHFCFNVVTREEGVPHAVLIRGAEPLEGIDGMAENRFKKPYEKLSPTQKRNFANGPGKLCKAMGLDKRLNGADLCGSQIYIVEGKGEKVSIGASKRIGIDYAGEAKDYLWRFYIKED